MVGVTLADGWNNVGGWLGQRWRMVGATLADGWGNVGRWLGQRWPMVGITLADGWGNVVTIYAIDVGATLVQRAR